MSMRGESEVRQRLKQVLFRHRKKLLDRNFKRRPFTCVHNTTLTLDGVEIGICGFDGEGGPTGCVCDTRHRGGAQARECSFWSALRTPEEIKVEFQDFIQTADRGEVALEYPDVVALMWVVGDENTLFPLDQEDAPVTPEPTWLDKLLKR